MLQVFKGTQNAGCKRLHIRRRARRKVSHFHRKPLVECLTAHCMANHDLKLCLGPLLLSVIDSLCCRYLTVYVTIKGAGLRSFLAGLHQVTAVLKFWAVKDAATVEALAKALERPHTGARRGWNASDRCRSSCTCFRAGHIVLETQQPTSPGRAAKCGCSAQTAARASMSASTNHGAFRTCKSRHRQYCTRCVLHPCFFPHTAFGAIAWMMRRVWPIAALGKLASKMPGKVL